MYVFKNSSCRRASDRPSRLVKAELHFHRHPKDSSFSLILIRVNNVFYSVGSQGCCFQYFA